VAAEKSGTGLPRNTAAALSYLLGPISGFLFLVFEKDPFVRFHSAQSVVVFGLLLVLWVIFFPLVPLLVLIGFILWLVLIYKAWMGEEFEVPVLGKYARKIIKG